MTGLQTAGRIERAPLAFHARQLLGDKHNTFGFDHFTVALVLKLKSGWWANAEIRLDQVGSLMANVYSPDVLDPYMQAIERALTELGRYDTNDDRYPWNAEPGSCEKCGRHTEKQNVRCTNPLTFTEVCIGCGRRWWCAGDTWQQVTEIEKFDEIRQGIIATLDTVLPAARDRVFDGFSADELKLPEMPYRVLWPSFNNLNPLMDGKTIYENVPVGWNLKAGDVIPWNLAQYSGQLRVVRCDAPTDDEVRCAFVKTP